MDHKESFQRKAYGLDGFDTFFSLFPTEFLVFACICCCFLSQWNIELSYRIDNLSMTNIFVVPSKHNSYAPIERFYCLSLKAIEFNGVDTTDFLGNFVVLRYLFIFNDILNYIEKSHVVKK